MEPFKQFPARAASAHKSLCGRVGVLAGSEEMLGAAVLSARAALRAGAGLVTLFTVSKALATVNVCFPEIMVKAVPECNGGIDFSKAEMIQEILQSAPLDCLVIGPGLGQGSHMTGFSAFLNEYINQSQTSIVLDADGLNSIAYRDLRLFPKNRFILTPHEGEFKQLFEVSTRDFIRDVCLDQVCEDLTQVIVLKGQETLVQQQEERFKNMTGNPGMATAGAGDVLTGVIAAFVGQELSHFEASKMAVYYHGLAGDKVYQNKGNGLIASDLIEALPELIYEASNE